MSSFGFIIEFDVLVNAGWAALALGTIPELTEDKLDKVRMIGGVERAFTKGLCLLINFDQGIDWRHLRPLVFNILRPSPDCEIIAREAAFFAEDKSRHVFTVRNSVGRSASLISYGFHTSGARYDYSTVKQIVDALQEIDDVTMCTWSNPEHSSIPTIQPAHWYHPVIFPGRRRAPIVFHLTFVSEGGWDTRKDSVRRSLVKVLGGRVVFDGRV